MSDQESVQPSEDDVEGHRLVRADDPTDDVEGHKRPVPGLEADDDVEGHKRPVPGLESDEDDVEGHRAVR